MRKGFTLIELLLVVAIIALLSSLAVVSLMSVRAKANQSKIKNTLSQMRTAAESYYADHGTYKPPGANIACGSTDYPASCAGMMFADPELKKFADQVDDVATLMTLKANTTSWGGIAKLTDGTWWCVDNSGYVGRNKNPQGTASGLITCSGSTVCCDPY